MDETKECLEIWVGVKGFHGHYEVSSLGRVKSLSRKRKYQYGWMIVKEKLLKPRVMSKGYLGVVLYKNSKKTAFKLHRLVASHFDDSFTNELQINHKDGNKKNNNYLNLECVTGLQNMEHSWKMGLHNNQGENHTWSKFSVEDIKSIRKSDKSVIHLAKLYGVCSNTIYAIRNKKSWKSVA